MESPPSKIWTNQHGIINPNFKTRFTFHKKNTHLNPIWRRITTQRSKWERFLQPQRVPLLGLRVQSQMSKRNNNALGARDREWRHLEPTPRIKNLFFPVSDLERRYDLNEMVQIGKWAGVNIRVCEGDEIEEKRVCEWRCEKRKGKQCNAMQEGWWRVQRSNTLVLTLWLRWYQWAHQRQFQPPWNNTSLAFVVQSHKIPFFFEFN